MNATLEGLVFGEPAEAGALIQSFVNAGRVDELRLDGYAGGRRVRATFGRAGVTVVDRGAGAPARRTDAVKPDDALEVELLPATLEDVREKLLGEHGVVTRGQRFDGEFEGLALAVEDVEPLVELLRAALRARPLSEIDLEGTLEGLPFKAKVEVDREGHSRVTLDGLTFASEQDVDRLIARFEGAEGLRELTITGSAAGQKLRRVWQEPRRPGLPACVTGQTLVIDGGWTAA